MWEQQRLGRKVLIGSLGIAAATYGYIWYSSPDYDGAAYVELPGVGPVEFEIDSSYLNIIENLNSGDPDRVQSAIDRIERNAIAQGLMQEYNTEGD